jgi:hypothetical protein
MKINRPVLGSGTLHFGDFDIEVKGVEFETVTHCIGEASEATFTTHNFEIIQREEKEEVEKEKRDELCSVEVVFDSSGKIYEYLIDSDAYWCVNVGDQYFILNEAGYDYRNAKVTIKKWKERPSEAATRRIIALRNSSRKVPWIDDGFIANNRPRQRMVDQWIEKNNAGDVAANAIAEKVKEVKYGFTDSITSSLSALSEKVDNLQEAFNNTSSMMTITADKMTFSTLPTQTFKKEYKAYFNNDNEKGEDKMNIFGNIEFGKLKNKGNYALTLKGLAYLKNLNSDDGSCAGYVQYDPETDSVEDVTPFVLKDMDIRDFVYKMPVALSAVSRGDIILDKGKPVFVKAVDGSTFTVVEPYTCEVKTLLAAKNAFGFNYVTKVVNLMDNFNLAGAASADNPFGNLLPLMMLSGNKNMEDMMPLFLMGGGAMEGDLTSNPMMMYFLMKDGEMNDMLPFFLMSKGSLFNAPAKEKANEEV